MKSITSGEIYKLLREKEIARIHFDYGAIIISDMFCSLSFLDEHYGEQFYLIEMWWVTKEFIHRKSLVLSTLSLEGKCYS